MIEMEEDTRRPKDDLNTKPMYCAVWRGATQKMIGSGWRPDLADTTALAVRMNGKIIRGYFAGVL